MESAQESCLTFKAKMPDGDPEPSVSSSGSEDYRTVTASCTYQIP